MLVDTHAHLYAEEFSGDRNLVIDRAVQAGVRKIILPNIDKDSVDSLLNLSDVYPGNCFPLMGLHPTSVKNDFREQISLVERWLSRRKFFGIGEIGIDLYWDKSHFREQQDAFRIQLEIAKSMRLPVVIHVRDSFDEVFSILEQEQNGTLSGIFHCFSGSSEQAGKVTGQGFHLGIGGVVTFRNSNLPEVIKGTDLSHIVLETDAPYLAPVPYRGKRNESTYLTLIAEKIAGIYEMSTEEIAATTTQTAEQLFDI